MSNTNHAHTNAEMLLHKSFTLGRFQSDFQRRWREKRAELEQKKEKRIMGEESGNAEFTGQQIQELDAFYPIITQLIEAGIQRQKLGHIMSLSVFTTFARRYLEEHAGENLVMFAHMLRDFLADFQGEVISQKERGFIQLNPDAQKTRTKEVQDTIASAIDDILQS